MARIQAKIIPNAPKSMVVGIDPKGVFRIKVAAPPQRGAANKELLVFLARRLDVKRSDIAIVTGGLSRLKIIEVKGMGLDEVKARLQGV